MQTWLTGSGSGVSTSDIVEKFMEDIRSSGEAAVESAGRVAEKLSEEDQLVIVTHLLRVFTQANFTGPRVPSDHPLMALDASLGKRAGESLVMNGEGLTGVASCLCALAIAKEICALPHTQESLQLPWLVWQMRGDFLHQRCLDSPSALLRNALKAAQARITQLTALSVTPSGGSDACTLSPHDQAALHMEFSAVHLFHHRDRTAQQHLVAAAEAIGTSFFLSGVMGRRMRFQQEDKAGLALCVRRRPNGPSSQPTPTEQGAFATPAPPSARVPEVEASHEDLLPQPIVRDTVEGQDLQLSPLEVCLLVGMGVAQCASQVGDLPETEAYPMFQRASLDAVDFCPHLVAREFIAKVRSERTRTQESALGQMEALVTAVVHEEQPAPSLRQRLFFQLPFSPWWGLKSRYARICRSLGLIKTALDIHLELEQWEDAVHCCVALGRLSQVEEMILERLEAEREPKLLVILGDIRDDENLYNEAWELSNHRYANAKRRLGRNAVQRGDFSAAVGHFEDAVKANVLHEDTWFRLGSACTVLKNHARAAQAYSECVMQDPTNGQAWNNLAAALVEIGKPREAHSAFKQAIKYLREQTQIWENFLVVSVRLREFGDVLQAVETLVARQTAQATKSVDTQALSILVDVAEQRIEAQRAKAAGVQQASSQGSEPVVEGPVSIDVGDVGDVGEVEVQEERSCLSKWMEGYSGEVVHPVGSDQTRISPETPKAADSGVPEDWFVRRVGVLFERIVQDMTALNATVWGLYARFMEVQGEIAVALEYQISCCKITETAGWESDREQLGSVLAAHIRLAQLACKAPNTKKMFTVKSKLRGILKRCEANFSGEAAVTELEGLLEAVGVREQELKAAN